MEVERALDILGNVPLDDKLNPEYIKQVQEAFSVVKTALERPTGEWIETDKLWEDNLSGGMGYDYGYYFACSRCKHEVKDKTNFCPNCKADMRGKKNE